jgi:hypothetical protein
LTFQTSPYGATCDDAIIADGVAAEFRQSAAAQISERGASEKPARSLTHSGSSSRHQLVSCLFIRIRNPQSTPTLDLHQAHILRSIALNLARSYWKM